MRCQAFTQDFPAEIGILFGAPLGVAELQVALIIQGSFNSVYLFLKPG